MKSTVIAAVLLMSFAVPLSAELTQPGVRKAAPDFVLHDETGAAVQLSKFRGKVVLLDFWATWCAGCKIEIPWLRTLVDEKPSRSVAAAEAVR